MITRLKRKGEALYRKLGSIFSVDKNVYLVYTLAKVGSTSVYQSLQKIKPFSDVFHVHFLSDNWLNKLLPQGHEVFHRNIKIGKGILKHIERNPHKRIKIITLTREPIARAISAIFETWEHIFDDIEKVNKEDIQHLIETTDHEYTLNWFDTEFFDYLDIDLYKLPFDPNKGYAIYNYQNLDILCLKLEMLNKVATQAFTEFLGFDVKLYTANQTNQKKHKDKYLHLKNNVRIKKELLSALYQSKYMQHFYTEQEIVAFIERWGKP